MSCLELGRNGIVGAYFIAYETGHVLLPGNASGLNDVSSTDLGIYLVLQIEGSYGTSWAEVAAGVAILFAAVQPGGDLWGP